MALLKGAFKCVQDEVGLPEHAMLVMGLPKHLFSRQRDRLKQLAGEAYKGEIKVVPQGVTDADGNEGMTDAVVKLMREMDNEF